MNDNLQDLAVKLPHKKLASEPVTLHEIEEETKKRLSLINHEFIRGFEFIKNQPKSVTIFGSSHLRETSKYYRQAQDIGFKLAKLGYAVLTGGGPGIMEGANRGAFEATGKSLGINIVLPNEQSRNAYLTDSLECYYFFTRKVILSFSAEAYIFFPGGFGTFDELFEILTLVQTKKIERVPIILMGADYWHNVENTVIQHMLDEGMIDKADMDLYTITDDESKVVEIVKNVPVRNGVRFNHSGAPVPEVIEK